MENKTLKRLQIFAIVALAVALADMPYYYYQLLRWAISGLAVYSAFLVAQNEDNSKKYEHNDNGWVLVFIAIAIMYNPLVPIALDRSMWTVINIITAIIVWVSISKLGYRLLPMNKK